MKSHSDPSAPFGAPTPRRIGLLGGSFDPVHNGHLHAAHAALAAFALDRVVFVPAFESPHKVGVRMASGADRLAMLALAIRGEERFCTSALELERGGRSYTIDTVRALPAHIGERDDCALFLIVGSDNVRLLPTWHEAQALLGRVQPIVVHRDGEPDALLGTIEAQFGLEIAAKLRAGYLQLPPVRVSSTEVRARLAGSDAATVGLDSTAFDAAHLDPALLDPSVLDYIRAHHLYGLRP